MPVLFLLPIAALLISGCAVSHDQLRQAIADDPEIVLQLAEKHPDRFVAALERAQVRARQIASEKATLNARNRREEELKHPKAPAVTAERAVRGDAHAPLTIAFYGDFTAPDCARAAATLENVRRRYGHRLKIVYKHLLPEGNETARLAALYFEGISLQSADKAYAFHDALFHDNARLTADGEKFLRRAVRRAHGKPNQLSRDLKKPEIAARLAADAEEVRQFALSTAPTLIVEGVTLVGLPDEEAISVLLDRRLKELGAANGLRGVSSVEE